MSAEARVDLEPGELDIHYGPGAAPPTVSPYDLWIALVLASGDLALMLFLAYQAEFVDWFVPKS